MGELASRLERIAVEARSPDGRLRAWVSGRLDLGLEFVPRAYRRYGEADLCHQLGRLATLTWTRYHREYVAVEDEFLDWPVRDRDAHDRLFEERAEQLTVDGVSPNGLVTVHTRALMRWDFQLAPGVSRRLDEQRFVAEVLGAAADTVRAYRARRARLFHEFYDLTAGLPPWVRARARRLSSGGVSSGRSGQW
jgi:hypothetical protein